MYSSCKDTDKENCYEKVILVLLAFLLIGAYSISVGANDICESYGEIPKVDVEIKIDGQMDPAYQYGINVQLTRDFEDGHDRSGEDVHGQMWMIYDDTNLYVFMEAVDSEYWDITNLITICDKCGKQEGEGTGCEHNQDPVKCNIWDDDCFEFFVDWTNNASYPSQFRVSRSDFGSRDWDTWVTGFACKANNQNGKWYAELSIPLDNSKEGTELGIHGMLVSQNTLDPYSQTISVSQCSAGFGGGWSPEFFDYIVLGKPIAITTTDPVQPTSPAGSTDNNPVVPTDSNGQAVQPDPSQNQAGAGQTTVNPSGPAQTADPIVVTVVAALLSISAAVEIKKTCFKS